MVYQDYWLTESNGQTSGRENAGDGGRERNGAQPTQCMQVTQLANSREECTVQPFHAFKATVHSCEGPLPRATVPPDSDSPLPATVGDCRVWEQGQERRSNQYVGYNECHTPL